LRADCEQIATWSYLDRIVKHATDSCGRIYVVLRSSDRLLRFESWFDTNPRIFGESGSGVGEFLQPRDVWVDLKDRIHVDDSGNGRIVRIDDISGSGWTVITPDAPTLAEPVS
jgi:hypothetical protein